MKKLTVKLKFGLGTVLKLLPNPKKIPNFFSPRDNWKVVGAVISLSRENNSVAYNLENPVTVPTIIYEKSLLDAFQSEIANYQVNIDHWFGEGLPDNLGYYITHIEIFLKENQEYEIVYRNAEKDARNARDQIHRIMDRMDRVYKNFRFVNTEEEE